MRRHLKTDSGEKSYKCCQCDFVSYRAGNIKRPAKRRRKTARKTTETGTNLYKKRPGGSKAVYNHNKKRCFLTAGRRKAKCILNNKNEGRQWLCFKINYDAKRHPSQIFLQLLATLHVPKHILFVRKMFIAAFTHVSFAFFSFLLLSR